MPITLEKLFSPSLPGALEYLGETVNFRWSPSRYTGEMDDLAEQMDRDQDEDKAELADMVEAGDNDGVKRLLAEIQHRDRQTVRRFLAALLVEWDVMDGRKPFPTDEAALAKLPPEFLSAVFREISSENRADPPKPERSDEPSAPVASSATSRRGSRSSAGRTTSASRRGK